MPYTKIRIVDFITNRSRWLALLCILSSVIPAYWLRKAHINNTTEVWLGRNSPDVKVYRQFLAKYGNEDFIVIAADANDPLSSDTLSLQRHLSERLRQIDGVKHVLSLSDTADALSPFRADWKDLIRNNELFQNLLLSENGQTFGLIAYLKSAKDSATQKQTVEDIEQAVDEILSTTMDSHLAGASLMNVDLDRSSLRTCIRFLPAAIVLSLVILAIVLRSTQAVVAVIMAVGVTTLWTMGLLVGTGKTLNMITIAIPSLLFVLSLSGGIHITSRFLSLLPGEGHRTLAIHKTLTEVIRPVFLSNITTAVGFSALMISDMEPVVEFGLFTGIGIMLSFVFNVTIIPGLLCLIHPRTAPARLSKPHWTARAGRYVCRHKGVTLVLALPLFMGCIACSLHGQVESNVLEFFPKNSKIRQDYDFIGRQLTGLYTIEIDATTTSQTEPALLKAMDQLGTELLEHPHVAKILHYGTLASCLKSIPLPAFVLSQAMQNSPLNALQSTYRHEEGDQRSLRLSIFIRTTANSDFYALLDDIKKKAQSTLSAYGTYETTGIVSLSKAAQESLIDTQIHSFALAGSLILILIALFMRSVKAAVAAIIPNLLPIFAIFAIMALCDIPFDTATVMIASVAIGISVDDTVHFLAHFKEEKRSGKTTLDAVGESLHKVGRAVTYTSVVATASFIVLLLGEFKPIQYFGFFTGITMITAWFSDIFILPACVAVLRLWD